MWGQSLSRCLAHPQPEAVPEPKPEPLPEPEARQRPDAGPEPEPLLIFTIGPVVSG